MIGNVNRIKGQRGFSMAEVVVAVALFVASILGVSAMLVSGSQNVTRGARDSAAANLAKKKIEEVKSLPFYRPWEGTNHDIDDFYWAFEGTTPRPNDQQFANPKQEAYGSIPGYGAYRRTTAVKYQYVNGSSLADASMSPSWVPKSPTAVQIDRPTGGASGGPYDTIHSVLIEVKVYFRDGGGVERSYTAHGLAGDLMVTGGTNNPPLIINSISPTYGQYMTDTNLLMTIYVTTPPGTLGAGSKLDVYLWYPGCTDVHATSVVANAAGTEITCRLNLTSGNNVRPGFYNVAVYWKDKGWNAHFRDNVFEVRVPPPGISSISSNNWGYSAQTARQITITGTSLWDGTVRLIGPNPTNNYIINGSVVSNNGTTMVANFNLTGSIAQRPLDSLWNVEITSAGGVVSSDTDAKRFLVNPRPVFTRVSVSSPGNYYDWAYKTQTERNVRLEGQYLYGFNDTANRQARMGCTTASQTYTSANAVFVSGPNGNSCNSTDPVVLKFNPGGAIGDCSASPYHSDVHNTRWNINILGNWGTASSSSDIQRVLMNPAPQVTGISGLVGGYRKTGTVSTVTINGQYFQNSAGFYLINNGGTYPSGTNQTCIISMSGTTNAGGTQITGIAENLDKNSFKDWRDWSTLAGTSAALNSTTYVTLLQNGNYDWQSAWPANSVTIQHAPIAVTYSSNTYQYNNWDQAMANISGAWFYPGETSWALYTSGGDWAGANPSSVATIQGGSVSGSYGSSQTITGLSYNCLNLPTGVYKIRVWDSENGKVASTLCDFTCQQQAPTGSIADSREDTNLGLGSGTGGTAGWSSYTGGPQVGVSSTISGMRGLYNVSGVTWQSPMWRHTASFSCIVGFCSGSLSSTKDGDYTYTATGVTLNANRSAKTLTVTYNISLFRRFNSGYHFKKDCTFTDCDEVGYRYLDYKQSAPGGGDVNNITLTGGWGSTVESDPDIQY